MKRILLLTMIISAMNCMAQKETYDLISHTSPKGWKKETQESAMIYTIINNKTRNWCRVAIFKSTESKGSIDADFNSEWNMLVATPYHITKDPAGSDVVEAGGWKIKAAAAPFVFDSMNAIAMITTFSGHGRCASVVTTTNSEAYLETVTAFLESIDLKKPPPTTEKPAAGNNALVIGTWMKTANNTDNFSVNQGAHGYFSCQYTFKENGTYDFVSRNFSYMEEIFFSKENGTYKVTGNTLVITPQKSVIQRWTKGFIIEANGNKAYVDKLGKLISSQSRTLEKTTYRITKEYMSGIQEWNLLLVADKTTLRDGSFNGGSYYPNTWLYKEAKYPVKTD